MSVGISEMSLITVCLPAYKIPVNIPGMSLPQSEYSLQSVLEVDKNETSSPTKTSSAPSLPRG